MDHSQGFCPCGGSVHPACFSLLDILPYLTGGDQPMAQEGTNGESSTYTLPGGPPIGYDHPMGSNEVMDGSLIPMPGVAGAQYPLNSSAGAQYLLHPSAGADHHALYGVPGRRLYETFDDGSNASYLAPALPSISTHQNVGNIFPSPSSATTDTTLYPNITEYLSEILPRQPVGSNAMRKVSTGRRKKRPIFSCRYPGCTATFTAKHNYKCAYFFTGNISSD